MWYKESQSRVKKEESEGKQKDVGRAVVMTTEMKKADISNKSLAGYIQTTANSAGTRESFAWR